MKSLVEHVERQVLNDGKEQHADASPAAALVTQVVDMEKVITIWLRTENVCVSNCLAERTSTASSLGYFLWPHSAWFRLLIIRLIRFDLVIRFIRGQEDLRLIDVRWRWYSIC